MTVNVIIIVTPVTRRTMYIWGFFSSHVMEMQTNIKKLPRISKYCNFCDVVCVMTDSCECVTIDLHELQERATTTRVTMVMTTSCIEVEKKNHWNANFFLYLLSHFHMPHYYFADSNTTQNTDDSIISSFNK